MNGFIRSLGASAALVALFSVGCASTGSKCGNGSCGSQNGGCSSTCKYGLRDRAENFDYEQLHPDHCWPNQYAREAYRRTDAPFGTQMNNGNALECTLWPHYFLSDEGKQGELNAVGKSRLEYLARKRPYVIPSLYLQTSFDPKLDEARIKNIVEYAASKSMEPNAWQVSLVNRDSAGLFGREAPKAIDKMVGTGDQPPRYEAQIKSGFLQGSGGSGAGGGK